MSRTSKRRTTTPMPTRATTEPPILCCLLVIVVRIHAGELEIILPICHAALDRHRPACGRGNRESISETVFKL